MIEGSACDLERVSRQVRPVSALLKAGDGILGGDFYWLDPSDVHGAAITPTPSYGLNQRHILGSPLFPGVHDSVQHTYFVTRPDGSSANRNHMIPALRRLCRKGFTLRRHPATLTLFGMWLMQDWRIRGMMAPKPLPLSRRRNLTSSSSESLSKNYFSLIPGFCNTPQKLRICKSNHRLMSCD